jgi:hypothetical protein
MFTLTNLSSILFHGELLIKKIPLKVIGVLKKKRKEKKKGVWLLLHSEEMAEYWERMGKLFEQPV